MISQLIKLANIFDQLGKSQKADRLDAFITRWAQAEEEPTPEDLMKEEEWLKDEGITTEGDDGQTYFEADPTEGLEGADKELAQAYLKTAPDIAEMLKTLEMEKNKILSMLDKLSGDQGPKMEPEISNLPITPEASLLHDLEKLANMLDQHKMFKAASFFDNLMDKIAQGLPPDDMFGEEDDEFGDEGSLYDDLDEFSEEPSTDELLTLEQQEEEFKNQMIEVMTNLEEGVYQTLAEAQDAARKVMMAYDNSLYSEEDFGPLKPQSPKPQPPMGKVLKFPGV